MQARLSQYKKEKKKKTIKNRSCSSTEDDLLADEQK